VPCLEVASAELLSQLATEARGSGAFRVAENWQARQDVASHRGVEANVLSRDLEKSLHRALAYANERRHEYATVEHLLLALTEDQDAVAVLLACGVDLDRLRREVLNYVDNELGNLVAAHGDDAKPTASFQRVLQRAAIHVQSSGREEVTGANVLVAMFAERECHAVYYLQEQDMTRFDAVNYIVHGIAKAPGRSETRRVQGADEDERGPMTAPYIPPGGAGWGMWGPVPYIKGRLAFMKAELEITDAQERLWEVFAEALGDFLKSRSRSSGYNLTEESLVVYAGLGWEMGAGHAQGDHSRGE
jgi:hypothetical protein